MVQKVKEGPILAEPAKCVGCFRCALICSFRFEKAFNPRYAKIKIVPADRSIVLGMPEISFTDDCDGCGICIEACLYGALTREKATKA
jgi:Fe-S-cluster-containing dehydrogenase component